MYVCVKTGATERYEVCARGELQLAVILEGMRRDGLEVAVSPPAVLTRYVTHTHTHTHRTKHTHKHARARPIHIPRPVSVLLSAACRVIAKVDVCVCMCVRMCVCVCVVRRGVSYKSP